MWLWLQYLRGLVARVSSSGYAQQLDAPAPAVDAVGPAGGAYAAAAAGTAAAGALQLGEG